jgi:hypothetical protein
LPRRECLVRPRFLANKQVAEVRKTKIKIIRRHPFGPHICDAEVSVKKRTGYTILRELYRRYRRGLRIPHSILQHWPLRRIQKWRAAKDRQSEAPSEAEAELSSPAQRQLLARFCPSDRLHGDAFLLTKEEQMPLHEASISALTARLTGACGARPSAMGCMKMETPGARWLRKRSVSCCGVPFGRQRAYEGKPGSHAIFGAPFT